MNNKNNTGYSNTGDSNTGDLNTGNFNTGDSNTGNCNTGNRNTGNRNTGYSNTGDRNTGDRNTGNFNTGNCNTGDLNTGDWNTGNCNTGFFNTIEQDIFLFNKPTNLKRSEIYFPNFLYFNLTEWISIDGMTEDEKSENKGYEILGGYLKKHDYKKAFKKAYNSASDKEKQQLLNLPNFDPEIFKEISGIDVKEPEKMIIVNGKEYSEATLQKAMEQYVNK